jgi:peptidoglycan hydrolase-like protein with peptidoglycan-binding domain
LRTEQPWGLGPPLQILPQNEVANEEGLSGVQNISTRLLNLTNRQDVVTIQKQLRLLGYLKGSVDGRWGSSSKAALAKFRIDHQLDEIGFWDENIQFVLFSAAKKVPVQVENSFVKAEILGSETNQPRYGR